MVLDAWPRRGHIIVRPGPLKALNTKYVKADATAVDIRAMKIEDAKRIFREKYWNAQRCDDLPAGVDYVIFDYGVNSGVARSGKILRRLLNLSSDTTAITDTVVGAAYAADAEYLIKSICDERLRFLQLLKTWPVFGVGWRRRVAEVRSTALKLAADDRTTLSVHASTEL
jgi:lysozyme family protein